MKKRGTRATSIGVVYSRLTGKVVRVFNPTFEQELDAHFLAPHEYMLRVDKGERGISTEPDSMTLDDLYRLIEVMQ